MNTIFFYLKLVNCTVLRFHILLQTNIWELIFTVMTDISRQTPKSRASISMLFGCFLKCWWNQPSQDFWSRCVFFDMSPLSHHLFRSLIHTAYLEGNYAAANIIKFLKHLKPCLCLNWVKFGIISNLMWGIFWLNITVQKFAVGRIF